MRANFPAVPAMQTIDYASFQSKYLANFNPKNIILFIQDALSVEDLSSHPSEFQAVNKWMTESHSLYLPNVEEPGHLTHDLASHGYNVVSLEPGVPAAGLDLKQQDNNLVVVKLPSTLTNPSRSHALQKAVEVMQNVISKVGAKREFTFIFTGLKPSVEDTSNKYDARVRVRRAADILQERGFHSVSCVKMYFKQNFTLTIYDDSGNVERKLTIDDHSSTDTGHCDTPEMGPVENARLSLKFTNGVEPFTRVTFTFNFKQKSNSWGVTFVEVLLDNSKATTDLDLVTPDISGIPVGMSYSCALPVYFSTNATSTGNKMDLLLEGVQMEAFFEPTIMNNGTFGPAWDCVGFFTVPIWAGLLTTLLLLLIPCIGLYMLSDIKTMDRFDDPKGQPIMVPNTD